MDSETLYIILIYASVVLALLWAAFNAYVVLSIKLVPKKSGQENEIFIDSDRLALVQSIGEKISNGANAFLYQEYLIMLIFIVIFGAIVLIVVDIFG